MNAAEYKELRQAAGSQEKVAEALGINITTLQRREAGTFKITSEAAGAMRHLVSAVLRRGRHLTGKMGRPKRV
jgi:DNA-binding transcriptional regulator YiaG